MKRVKLKKARQRKEFHYKPRAWVHREKILDELRDLPVAKLSRLPQHVEMINSTYCGDQICCIAFATRKGTVHLTADTDLLNGLYLDLREMFGPIVPKKVRVA